MSTNPHENRPKHNATEFLAALTENSSVGETLMVEIPNTESGDPLQQLRETGLEQPLVPDLPSIQTLDVQIGATPVEAKRMTEEQPIEAAAAVQELPNHQLLGKSLEDLIL